MEKALRALLLSLGRSRLAQRLARRYGLRMGARRFVAGSSIAQAIAAVRRLNEAGRMATLDHLGEYVGTEAEAGEAAAMCLRTLDAIAEAGVSANLSLKLTSLGLDLDADGAICRRHMRMILERARRYGHFVRIDMEDYAHCERTLALYRGLRSEGFDHVGVVIQAYLYRSERDIGELNRLGANVRLVKGAYRESPDVAYPHKADVDGQFARLIRIQLESGCYTAIATHDAAIIEQAKAWVRERGLAKEAYEFQMLYGIAEDLQEQLVQEGYRVRIYVPFGTDWFGYFMRRLAERPANVGFVLRNWRR